MKRKFVTLALAVVVSAALAACFETLDAETKTGASAARSAKASKATHASAATNAAEQVRQRIRSECLVEVGGLFGADETHGKQCECYARAIVKALRKEDLEYYINYGQIPTLTITRPDDLKKACGINAAGKSG